jgi:hypothetical protein
MQCDVTDSQGNYCPENAVHTVIFKGIETYLCERCYANVLAGAYGNAPNTVSTGLAATSAKTGHAYQPELFTVKPAESTPAASR